MKSESGLRITTLGLLQCSTTLVVLVCIRLLYGCSKPGTADSGQRMHKEVSHADSSSQQLAYAGIGGACVGLFVSKPCFTGA